jgi:hypothetical protein
VKADDPKDVIKNWLRNRATVEYLGLWEKINNAAFKGVEFDSFKSQAASNSFYASEADMLNAALFGMTVKEWRGNLELLGNTRDAATVEQLAVLSNLESLNVVFVRQGIAQPERLKTLNE